MKRKIHSTKLKELDPSVTADDIRDLSMREIHDLIEEYSGGSSEESLPRDDPSDTNTSSDASCGYEEGDKDDYENDYKSGSENDHEVGHGHHE